MTFSAKNILVTCVAHSEVQKLTDGHKRNKLKSTHWKVDLNSFYKLISAFVEFFKAFVKVSSNSFRRKKDKCFYNFAGESNKHVVCLNLTNHRIILICHKYDQFWMVSLWFIDQSIGLLLVHEKIMSTDFKRYFKIL